MAHVRQKNRHGLVRGLGMVTCLTQRLGLFAHRDVSVCANHAQGAVVLVARNDHAARQHPLPMAITALDAVLVDVLGGAAVKVRLAVAQHLGQVVGVGQLIECLGAVRPAFVFEAIHLATPLRQHFVAGLNVPVPYAVARDVQR